MCDVSYREGRASGLTSAEFLRDPTIPLDVTDLMTHDSVPCLTFFPVPLRSAYPSKMYTLLYSGRQQARCVGSRPAVLGMQGRMVWEAMFVLLTSSIVLSIVTGVICDTFGAPAQLATFCRQRSLHFSMQRILPKCT